LDYKQIVYYKGVNPFETLLKEGFKASETDLGSLLRRSSRQVKQTWVPFKGGVQGEPWFSFKDEFNGEPWFSFKDEFKGNLGSLLRMSSMGNLGFLLRRGLRGTWVPL
jgi:hypothetical protein